MNRVTIVVESDGSKVEIIEGGRINDFRTVGTLLGEAIRRARLATLESSEDVESYCHRCGGPNITWCAPSPLWNAVMHDGSINGEWQYNEIICPICFAILAEDAGVGDLWRMYAERIEVPLATVTPSGRTWNNETWLWEEAAS